ncbi:MAG: hypothetical protein ACLU37_08985 [Collinsella sp.]
MDIRDSNLTPWIFGNFETGYKLGELKQTATNWSKLERVFNYRFAIVAGGLHVMPLQIT